MSALDAATRALIGVAASIHDADEAGLAAQMSAARAAGAPALWLDELVLMAVLFAGFPRALVAAKVWRGIEPAAPDAGDATDYRRADDWRARGEDTCRRIYGANYEALRRNVRALHPALDAWIVTDGYGRTLSRPGLDLRRRELCAVAMLAPQRVPRQLHSHLRGALHAGATEQDVTETLHLLETIPGVTAERLATARTLWDEVRSCS